MESNYKLKELKIILMPGVELTATVNSIDDIAKLLSDLKEKSFEPLILQPPKGEIPTPTSPEANNIDDPTTRIELNAALRANSLVEKKILAFKDNIPQFLRTSIFSKTTDALLVLLYAIEVGLRKNSIDYDSFKSLYDSQNIKSGSSLSMLLNNLKNAQYIDKNAYEKDRTLMLSPRGAQKAKEILNVITKK